MEQAQHIPYYFIYIGRSSGGAHKYLCVPKDLTDSPSAVDKSICVPAAYDKKLVKTHVIGGIYEVEYNGSNVKYSTRMREHSYWSNSDDIIKWKAFSKAVELREQVRKSNSSINLSSTLAPIKSAYKELSLDQRSLLIAEIIRIVTS